MIPMVSTVAEFVAARALFDKEIAFVKRCGREPPRDIKLGAMVEVPSLLWQTRRDRRRPPTSSRSAPTT